MCLDFQKKRADEILVVFFFRREAFWSIFVWSRFPVPSDRGSAPAGAEVPKANSGFIDCFAS